MPSECPTASCELAERDGPYVTYAGSPISQGESDFLPKGVCPYKAGL
jgi:hypothetical protein